MLDKNSDKPLYIQLKSLIIDSIKSGEYPPGARLPSENQIAARFNINRHTARVALNDLAKEDILKSVPGSCWAVNPQLKLLTGAIRGRTAFFGVSKNLFVQSKYGYELNSSILSESKLLGIEIDFFDFESDVNLFQYDNIIWANPKAQDAEMMRKLKEAGKYVVIANRQFMGMEIPFIAVDQYYGTKNLVSYLTLAGHKKIGCITLDDELNYNYVRERLRGFSDALWESKITPEPEYFCKVSSKEKTKSTVKKFLQRHPEITALFVGGEIFHQGTAHAVEELNLRIPEDLSVVFFDPPETLKVCPKPLCLRQPGILMAHELLDLLQALQNNSSLAASKILLNKIIPGNSVKNLE